MKKVPGNTRHQPTQQKPPNAKNLAVAFLILTLAMVGAQVINLIITLLPTAAEASIQVGDGTSVTVGSLRNAYILSVIIISLIYGLVWNGIRNSRNWARWIAVVLAVLAALGGVQGTAQILGAASVDFVGLALSLAQLPAAAWALALAFRKDVHDWFAKSAAKPARQAGGFER